MLKAKRKRLFVLRFGDLRAVKFCVAENEHEMLERSGILSIANRQFNLKPETRNPGMIVHEINKYKQELIKTGSIEVTGSLTNMGFVEKVYYTGKVTWKCFQVSETELAFLKKLGLV
jgi:hypothetical protein